MRGNGNCVMGTTVAQPSLPTPLLCSEKRAQTAKAALRKPENTHALLGQCMDDVRIAAGLTLDEFANALGKDPRQVKRQIQADERPQIEAVFGVERFQVLLVTALAKRIGQIEVETVIRIRRTA